MSRPLLYSWGVGYFGALGHGSYQSITHPKPLFFHSEMFDSHVSWIGFPFSMNQTRKEEKKTNERKKQKEEEWNRIHRSGNGSSSTCGIEMVGRVEVSTHDGNRGRLGGLGGLEELEKQQVHASKELLALNSSIASISTGWIASAMLTSSGQLYTWGSEQDMQTALRLSNAAEIAPKFVNILQEFSRMNWIPYWMKFCFFGGANLVPMRVEMLEERKIIKVDMGACFTIAVAEDGDVFTWGSNSHGQCGSGENVALYEKPRIAKFAGGKRKAKIIDCAAGFQHSLVLDEEGTVYASGNFERGALGLLRSILTKGTEFASTCHHYRGESAYISSA